MHIPKWRIYKGQVGNNNSGRVHQFNKRWSSIIQCVVAEPAPPKTSLTINGTISTCPRVATFTVLMVIVSKKKKHLQY